MWAPGIVVGLSWLTVLIYGCSRSPECRPGAGDGGDMEQVPEQEHEQVPPTPALEQLSLTMSPHLLPPTLHEFMGVFNILLLPDPTLRQLIATSLTEYGTPLHLIYEDYQKNYTIFAGAAERGRRWSGLGMSITEELSDIVMYRIRWFAGHWSNWYVVGLNDLDWKTNAYGADSGKRRVWSYFDDHQHQYIRVARITG